MFFGFMISASAHELRSRELVMLVSFSIRWEIDDDSSEVLGFSLSIAFRFFETIIFHS
jgi:hypothetical protein